MPNPRGLARRLRALALAAAVTSCDSGGEAANPVDDTLARDVGAVTADASPDEDTAPSVDAGATPTAPDWSRSAVLPVSGERKDILGLGDGLPPAVTRGLGYALVWPVDVSGVLLPARWMSTLFDPGATDETTVSLQSVARSMLGFGTLIEMADWLGLPYHDGSAEAFPGVPWPAELGGMPAFGEKKPLGVGVIDTPHVPAMSFSCATCHVADFFGHTIVGLTNRRARANEFFHLAKGFFPTLTPDLLQPITNATADELAQFLATQKSLAAIENITPQAKGLDTSLAQVALSLTHRKGDDYATFDPALEATPRDNALRTEVADSKPAVWWTMKFKTRWLLDGSIVSGNPVLTNFLWNEIGRGTDLHALEVWLTDNQDVVQDLTALVFASEPPRFTEIFGVDHLDVAAAKRGQPLFEAHCASCHGHYDKAWDAPSPPSDAAALVRTVRVRYPSPTQVVDVGTDLHRAKGMGYFADALNNLAISKWMGTVVEPQMGYVPPPLEGVFARYPYLHNQSVPNLCALLTPAADRPKAFWMGPDEDPATDYDVTCVGLPTEDVPESWKAEARNQMDTTRPGLSNSGHDAWLTSPNGQPVLSPSDRADLIEFLKTL